MEKESKDNIRAQIMGFPGVGSVISISDANGDLFKVTVNVPSEEFSEEIRQSIVACARGARCEIGFGPKNFFQAGVVPSDIKLD